MASAAPKDRQTRERERLTRIWASLAEEQESMRVEGDKLNGLTKDLEGLRDKLAKLEREVDLDASYRTGDSAARKKAQENQFYRESVLVQTLHVENRIKEGLDTMEKALTREKKRFHRVCDGVTCRGV